MAFTHILSIALLVVMASASPIPDQPRPYHPPHPAPYNQYPDEPVVLCAHYPYCDEAPHGLYHLQAEIEALRQRNALIVAAGEKIAQQQPNVPFVGGYQNAYYY